MLTDFTWILTLITVQALLGGFDNLWHHELTEQLPSRLSAKREIALHSARELIYALVFLVLAWVQPQGWMAWIFAAILGLEIIITLADFIEEDRTRNLPALERVLHTILALNYGAILVLLVPHITYWSDQQTGLVWINHGLWSPVFTVFAMGVFAWGLRDLIAAIDLHKRDYDRSRSLSPEDKSGRNVLITGGTGFLGQTLVLRLLARGDRVILLSRDSKKAVALFHGEVDVVEDLKLIAPQTRIHAIINLAGANVADMPWWPARRRVLVESRLGVTRAVTDLIDRLEQKPDVLVSASAIGAYGNRGETVLAEHVSRPMNEFTADLCRVWEDAARKAQRQAVRVCLLRFGLVLGLEGGAFPRMIMSRALGIVPQFGNGQQWMGWIHKLDAISIIERALNDDDMDGPINATAPIEARHGDVVAAIAGWRLIFPIPAFFLRSALGEMSDLFLASQRVRPQRLIDKMHTFKFPDIHRAVDDLCPKSRKPICTHRPQEERS